MLCLIYPQNSQGTYKDGYRFYVDHNGSIWRDVADDPTYTLYWIGFDLVNGSWGTLALELDQQAMIISRTPMLSNSIIQSQLALLQAEGYNANMRNTHFPPNKQCSMDFTF